jgi:glycerol uptake facilitator protein
VDIFIAEFIGTALLIILGNGVVANVVLNGTKGHDSGWIVITAGWGMAVFVAVFSVSDISGAHINPAVTIAMAAAGKLSLELLPVYVIAQLLGAFCGAALVYAFYVQHFRRTDVPTLRLACFATIPQERSVPHNLFSEIVGTVILVFPIFLMVAPAISTPAVGDQPAAAVPLGLGALGALPVGLLVFAIGMSLGGTTGYAINPARDLGPRLAHAALLGRRESSDWSYAWIPIVGPTLGALLAAAAYLLLTTIGFLGS